MAVEEKSVPLELMSVRTNSMPQAYQTGIQNNGSKKLNLVPKGRGCKKTYLFIFKHF